jgi:hypothetical protein
MPLTAGILIIGSLLWDSEKERPAWRAARVNEAAAQTVTAPIRYGKKARTRGNSFTMVFSRLCPPGTAMLVPCSHTISTPQDLITEAEHLWKAEQPDAELHRIASPLGWGCVAALCNPQRKLPQEILNGWAKRVADAPGYGKVPQTEAEGRLISKEGLLQIAWPRLVEGGAEVQLDILLVTANAPDLSGTPLCYPSVETIARAWNLAGGHAEYFWTNTDRGIRTFQDDEIRELLHPRGWWQA